VAARTPLVRRLVEAAGLDGLLGAAIDGPAIQDAGGR